MFLFHQATMEGRDYLPLAIWILMCQHLQDKRSSIFFIGRWESAKMYSFMNRMTDYDDYNDYELAISHQNFDRYRVSRRSHPTERRISQSRRVYNCQKQFPVIMQPFPCLVLCER